MHFGARGASEGAAKAHHHPPSKTVPPVVQFELAQRSTGTQPPPPGPPKGGPPPGARPWSVTPMGLRPAALGQLTSSGGSISSGSSSGGAGGGGSSGVPCAPAEAPPQMDWPSGRFFEGMALTSRWLAALDAKEVGREAAV
jgi:hypothetical protein